MTKSYKYDIILKLKRCSFGRAAQTGESTMIFNQNWLLAIGIAVPALFPNIAHSKPADDYVCPPRDEMCQLVDRSLRRMDQQPAQKPVAKPKPVTRSTPSGADLVPVEDARKAADAAERIAHDFKFALAFSR